MTSHRQTRCQHCQTRYHWQTSGWGAGQDNNGTYCPVCQAAIREALAEVPRRFEKVWVEVKGVSAVELHEVETARITAARAGGKLVAQRVAMGLYDLKDPSNRNVTGYASKDGQPYRYSYWTKDPEGTSEVKAPMERCIETGEDVPWVELERR